MSQELIGLIGGAAALCSMSSFVPQLVKMVREKTAEGVSLRMFIVTVVGFALWSVYGVMIGAWAVIAANVVCLILAGAILVLRLKYGADAPAAAPHKG
jgi:MtN3 and saliva related transmembrane protein